MAERVGFEPTCRLPDKTLSRRPRYDHFGTSPGLWRCATLNYSARPRGARICGLERLPQAEIETAAPLARPRIEQHAVVAAQQEPPRPHPQPGPSRLPKIGHGKIRQARKDIPHVGKHDAVEEAHEGEAKLVVDHQQAITTYGQSVRPNLAQRVLRKTPHRR